MSGAIASRSGGASPPDVVLAPARGSGHTTWWTLLTRGELRRPSKRTAPLGARVFWGARFAFWRMRSGGAFTKGASTRFGRYRVKCLQQEAA